MACGMFVFFLFFFPFPARLPCWWPTGYSTSSIAARLHSTVCSDGLLPASSGGLKGTLRMTNATMPPMQCKLQVRALTAVVCLHAHCTMLLVCAAIYCLDCRGAGLSWFAGTQVASGSACSCSACILQGGQCVQLQSWACKDGLESVIDEVELLQS